jgi:molybdate transport system substrate-binding protein
LEGAPADVVMLANEETMAELADAEVLSSSATAAGNKMVIATPSANPGGVISLADLGEESLLIGLCDIEVPCGSAARAILNAANITPAPDTNEPDVRALLAKIASAELDAGIVYETDLISAGPSVRGIEIDSSLSEPNLYPIAVLNGSQNSSIADRFLTYVLSDAGQAILADAGFLTRSQAVGQ